MVGDNDNKKIKLLMLTQGMDLDDDLVGFTHGWAAKLAGHCDKLTVVALGVGRYDLPENVKVFSLGKNKLKIENCKLKIIKKFIYLINFYRYSWRFRNDYDYVFVHMNKEYLALGGLFWRLWSKKTALWYNHRYGNVWGKLAGLLAHRIFFTSPFSFFSKNTKARQMPAGIDTEKFKTPADAEALAGKKNSKLKTQNSILFLGRLAPVKKPDVLLKAAKILDAQGTDFTLDFVGEPGFRDTAYFTNLKKEARELEKKGKVKFPGKVSNEQAPTVFSRHEIFVNLTDSGSFDKTILEAMACESMPLVSSQSYEKVLPLEFIFKEGDAEDLAVKLLKVLALPESEARILGQKFRQYVLAGHSLDLLVKEITASFKNL